MILKKWVVFSVVIFSLLGLVVASTLFPSLRLAPSQPQDSLAKSTTVYAYGPSGLLSKQAGGEVSYYHTDYLSSSSLVTDTDGKTVYRSDYEPFGDSLHVSGEERYTYTGKELDDSTGLYYYGARYYDASVGRFISVDPVQGSLYSGQRLNRYTYVLNNPLKYVDPSGGEPMRTFTFLGHPGLLPFNGGVTAEKALLETLSAFEYNYFAGGGNFDYLSGYSGKYSPLDRDRAFVDLIDFLPSANAGDKVAFFGHSSRDPTEEKYNLETDLDYDIFGNTVFITNLKFNDLSGEYRIEETEIRLSYPFQGSISDHFDYLLENDAFEFHASRYLEGVTEATVEFYGCALVECGTLSNDVLSGPVSNMLREGYTYDKIRETISDTRLGDYD